MMKDHKLVNKVIKRKQIATSRLLLRVYKVLKLILFEQLKQNNVEINGDLAPVIDREDLASYIEELNRKNDVSINEICELAHAWGHDHVSHLEAYLFLKKVGATLDKGVNLDDIELYLKFENEHSHSRPIMNIMKLFTMLFPDNVRGRVSVKEFLTVLGQYKSYFEPGDWEKMQDELDVAEVIYNDQVILAECTKHIEEQITHFPK